MNWCFVCTVTLQWKKLNAPGDYPSPRRRQCACVVGSKVYLFGGTGPGDKTQSTGQPDADLIDRSDLFVLDFGRSANRNLDRLSSTYNSSSSFVSHQALLEI